MRIYSQKPGFYLTMANDFLKLSLFLPLPSQVARKCIILMVMSYFLY